jgi:hypothetical protein
MRRGDFTNKQIRLRCHVRCRQGVRFRMGRIFSVTVGQTKRVFQVVNV